jgi:hypothetical protein
MHGLTDCMHAPHTSKTPAYFFPPFQCGTQSGPYPDPLPKLAIPWLDVKKLLLGSPS